jgi:hypothetical protein
MESSQFKLAQLSAMLARYAPNLSSYTCAELATKLRGISKSCIDVYTFECNGYKNEWQDNYINKLCHEKKINEANEYSAKIQNEGTAYCEKKKATIRKKLQKICDEYKLDIHTANLSGLCWQYEYQREYYI